MRVHRDELIAEAERIGAVVLRQGARGGELSLYNGAAGIALFLMKLAAVTQKGEYLDAACAAMRRVEAALRRNPQLPHGFYTGRAGIAYVLLRLGESTGEPRHAEAIEALGDPLAARQSHTADLLSGVAGTLLGVLHVHAATGEPSLLDGAAALVDDLIARARPARAGLYWDRSAEQVRGLCGLSHGATGIGWVFAELARSTGNGAFAQIARQAFAYENDHFDAARGNWPDFRRTSSRPEERELLDAAYLRGELGVFYERRDMNAWCHGAAGIGLARLRAFELLGDDAFHHDVQRAVRRVSADFERGVSPSATLCHGSFGNAALLFAAAPERDELVHRVIARAIAAARETGMYRSGHPGEPSGDPSQDTGLLMGLSGIGYFLLQVAAGERRDPLLLPALPPCTQTLPRCETEPRAFTGAHAQERWSLAENASLALLATRARVQSERADELLASRLRLSADAAAIDDVLLLATIDGCAEIALQPFTAAILAHYDQPRALQEVIERLGDELGHEPAQLTEVVTAQVRNAVASSILVPA